MIKFYFNNIYFDQMVGRFCTLVGRIFPITGREGGISKEGLHQICDTNRI